MKVITTRMFTHTEQEEEMCFLNLHSLKQLQ